MLVIAMPTRSGKTTECIRLAHEKDLYIVCKDMATARSLSEVASAEGFPIRFPLTFDEFIGRRFHAPGCKGFVIDNVDMMIQILAGSVPVVMVTATDEKNHERTADK